MGYIYSPDGTGQNMTDDEIDRFVERERSYGKRFEGFRKGEEIMELTKDQIRKAALREQIQQEIAGSYSKLPSPSQIIALADRILAIIEAVKAGEMSDIEWDASRDSMLALGPCVRMRAADGWELHSWNVYTQMAGGGRITPYPKEMFYAVWKRRQP